MNGTASSCAAGGPKKRVRHMPGENSGVGPSKRHKRDAERGEGENDDVQRFLDLGQHPYGVKPMGNYFFDVTNGVQPCRDSGLGSASVLTDELILDILGRLNAPDLCKTAKVSRAFYVFAHHDEMWRQRVLKGASGKSFRFRGSWKQTYVDMQPEFREYFQILDGIEKERIAKAPLPGGSAEMECLGKNVENGLHVRGDTENGGSMEIDGKTNSKTGKMSNIGEAIWPWDNLGAEDPEVKDRISQLEANGKKIALPVTLRPIKIRGFYSEHMFAPWLCASMGLDPSWLVVDNVERRSAKDFTVEQFIEEFEKPNRPVVITDLVTEWPAYQKWSPEYLIKEYGDATFASGPGILTMRDYYRYAHGAMEENPLYLFDKYFATQCPGLASDYTVPPYFNEDLFSLLGGERPDYRWIIIGPARSGSTFHIDPNCTSAWNAVIRGRKKWIMYPPNTPPPGVIQEEDEVTAPVSLGEWFNNCYKMTKDSDVRPIECIVEEGEVIFVPSGWWHVVINVEESIAITQNYVSRRNLVKVMEFIRDKPHDVSGLRGCKGLELYSKFYPAFTNSFPGEYEKLEEEVKEEERERNKPSFWDSLTAQKAEGGESGGFSFGF